MLYLLGGTIIRRALSNWNEVGIKMASSSVFTRELDYVVRGTTFTRIDKSHSLEGH